MRCATLRRNNQPERDSMDTAISAPLVETFPDPAPALRALPAAIRWQALALDTPPDRTPVLVRGRNGWGVAMFFVDDDLVSTLWETAPLGEFREFAVIE